MARDKEIFASGRVTYTTHSEALAEELWGRDESGATWEFAYFLDDVRAQAISNAALMRSFATSRARVSRDSTSWTKTRVIESLMREGRRNA
jgi:hypothetical protein